MELTREQVEATYDLGKESVVSLVLSLADRLAIQAEELARLKGRSDMDNGGVEGDSARGKRDNVEHGESRTATITVVHHWTGPKQAGWLDSSGFGHYSHAQATMEFWVSWVGRFAAKIDDDARSMGWEVIGPRDATCLEVVLSRPWAPNWRSNQNKKWWVESCTLRYRAPLDELEIAEDQVRHLGQDPKTDEYDELQWDATAKCWVKVSDGQRYQQSIAT